MEQDPKSCTLHMIGNAHIDPVWQWRWEEGRQEVMDTCRAALDRMDETEDFIFCRSSAATYEWVETYDPDLFARIKKRIEEGRWAIVGGWWEQPDCNLPSGESFVRQALYAKLYFLEKFGVEVRCGYNVDTFGHVGTLPQLLAKAGIDSYCFFRPGPHEMALPKTVFWWEAPDGSKVLTCRAPGHYGTGPWEIEPRIWECARGIEPELKHGMCFYGVGNHGGGPTKENIACIQRLREDPKAPRILFSSPEKFFDAIRDKASDLPVVREELQHHARGCYTAHGPMKAMNRRLEISLGQAEKMSACAELWTGEPAQSAGLREAWKKVLFNQFHDIMAGTSLRSAYDDVMEDYKEVDVAASSTVRRSVSRISGAISCPGAGRPVVVYNTLSFQRTDVVEVEVTWPRQTDLVKVVDDQGADVVCQKVYSAISGRGMVIRLAFVADVPALGYRTYRVVSGEAPSFGSDLAAGDGTLENDRVRISWHCPGVGLTRCILKREGIDLLSGPGNLLKVLHDPSDTWSHDVVGYFEEKGTFELERATILETGPVRCTVRMESRFGACRLIQDVSLTRESPRIDIAATLDYQGQHEALKLCFPLAVDGPEATYEVAYGFANREREGQEEPCHKWIDLTGGQGGSRVGLAVLNDSKFGGDVRGNEIRMTVLRSPIYCFHDPAKVDPRKRYELMDQGESRFKVALLPHAGDWREGEVVHHAHSLNQPLFAREEPAHAGALPPSQSLASFSSQNILIEALKKSEDGRDWVLRAYETAGMQTASSLTFMSKSLVEAQFRPCEVKTWRIAQREGIWEARESDLLERPLI